MYPGVGDIHIGQGRIFTLVKAVTSEVQDPFFLHDIGTQERVCLITGTVEGITQVHNFIMEKIMEKPDPSAAPPPPLPPGTSSSSASKEGLPYDRHKQVRPFNY